jgi:hypothetical protein
MIILTAQLSIINLWSQQITRIMPVDVIAIKCNVKLDMTNCNTTNLWLLRLFVKIHSRNILVKVMFWQRKQHFFLQQFKIVNTGFITGSKVTMFVWDRHSYFLGIVLRSICAHTCDWRTYTIPMTLFTLHMLYQCHHMYGR